MIRLLAAFALLMAVGARPGLAVDPVETARDLHIACGQTYDGFPDIVYEPVARSIMIAQCYAFATAAAQLIKGGAYSHDGRAMWKCVEVPEKLGALSDAYVRWIARRQQESRTPAAIAFMRAIEETFPCAAE